MGVEFIVVGSAALWIHGGIVVVHDLDVVVDPARDSLLRVHDALRAIGVQDRLPSSVELAGIDVVRMTGSFGPIDLMLGRGPREYRELGRRAVSVMVCGVGLDVVDASTANRLRRQFKG